MLKQWMLAPRLPQWHTVRQVALTYLRLFSVQIIVPKTANGIPYMDDLFADYRLSGGLLVWLHAMPPFPPPTSADTSPDTPAGPGTLIVAVSCVLHTHRHKGRTQA